MVDQLVCGADDCENSIADDRVELVELPVDGTGEWVGTGERDEEFGLEITEWTGDWQPINVGDCVECQHQPENEPIVAVLTRVGFDVHPTSRAPFETVSENERPEEDVLTGHSELTETAEKRARIMSSVGRVTRTRSVYVVDRATRDSVEGTAIIEEGEMEDISAADELRDMILDRAGNFEEPA